MKDRDSSGGGYGFGTFQGVYTPSILTIIGVVMYLRFGWVLGNVGLVGSLALVAIGSAITLLTGLSISTLATNMRMKGGGAYFMLSRSLGIESGAALGIPLALSQAVGVSFYVAGFAEALTQSGLPVVSELDVRVVGLVTLTVLALVSTLSADIALKSQYFIMAAIALSLVSFFAGSAPRPPEGPAVGPAPLGFWPVFAVFFPAVTGILSGLGMSGDLREPGRSIPLGTVAAVLTGSVVCTAVPVGMDRCAVDAQWLRADTMIMLKCARWPALVLAGVWAATLSSAVGSFLCAPRVVQALARDRILPRVFGKGYGETDDPRFAAVCCFLLAGGGLWFGDINVIAPILTMFNLSTYALLNFSAACESAMGNPSWRPTFRVKAAFSFAGFALCTGAMFMISPGWTFLALGCEGVIYWIVKRRSLNARWGDMRTGLFVALARFAMGKLEGREGDLRNWRPDVLAFTELPARASDVVDLARVISGDRGMVTLASVVPEAAGTPVRERDLANILRTAARRVGLNALTRIHAAPDVWTGMRELVRAYGFGPFVPDTILLGVPARDDLTEPFCDLASFLVRRRRNAVLVRDRFMTRTPGRRIDVWWRGQNQNGPFMLALAHLIQQSRGGHLKIRLCQIAPASTDPEDARRQLAAFLSEARVEADTFALAANPAVSPIAQIATASADAAFAFVGLRSPADDESAAAYADYFRHMRDALASVPCPVFALAAEGVDFKRIYRE